MKEDEKIAGVGYDLKTRKTEKDKQKEKKETNNGRLQESLG